MRIACLILVCTSALTAARGAAGAEPYPRPELLVEPEQLDPSDAAQRIIILDCRGKEEFTKEHIPGARWVDHEKWSKAFDDGRDAKRWSQWIGGLGIGAASRVVVYDDKGMRDAARIWWMLRYWGIQQVGLLNGGWKTWKAQSRRTTAEAAAFAPVAFHATPQERRLATRDRVLASLKTGALQIVDARSEKEFCGIDKTKNKRAGAIPGATHLDWAELVDQNTHRFKSPEELRRLFRAAGIDLRRPTAAYCQSGGRASVMAFALELLGARDVRNYYQGWSEWGNREETPIVVPKKAAP